MFIYTIEDAKQNKVIAFLWNVSTEKNLIINDNILLRETTKEEKEDYTTHSEGRAPKYCFEFRINEDYFEQLKYEPNHEDFILVQDMAWKLIELEEAINLSKEHPCEIARIDLSNDKEYIPDIADFCFLETHERYYDDVECKILETDLKLINRVHTLLLEIYNGYERDYKKFWWLTALEYYNRHDQSYNSADQIIDLVIGLESLLSYENLELSYRLKVRASLFLYYIDNYNPIQILQLIKEMYSIRSKIVHGSMSLSELESTECTLIPGTDTKTPFKVSISVAIRMLRSVLRIMLIESMFNHTDKSKKDFIEFIDAIWYMNLDFSKLNIIEDNERVFTLKKEDSE